MRVLRTLGVSILCLCFANSLAVAQTVSATTGAINGRVTDNTGAVLPGVTVTITSESLMGNRTAVTNPEGQYRFPAVPPGDYSLSYDLAGFGTVKREGIRVGLGFTATVNVEMAVASLQESVTVTGASPVVDTSATNITTNFQAEQLANLPNARDFWSILAQAPAISLQRIDVGGSAAGTQTTYYVYGTTGQNRPMVEGIVATEGTGAAGFYYDYGAVEEVSVGTAAHSAEMPWPGVQSQFISKSGGNTYHGSFYADYENESIQSFNVDAEQVARGAQGGGAANPSLEPKDTNRLTSYHDINMDAGGYLKKDKLWFYGSFRDQDVSANYVNFPVKPHRTRLTNYTGKGTYLLTENNKLIAYAQAGRKHQPTRLDPYGPTGGSLSPTTAININENSTWEQLYWGWVWKGEYNYVINDAMFLEVRAGQFGYNWPNKPNGSDPRVEDIGNSFVYGGNRDWQRDRRRNQGLGSLSYFKDNWAGTHNFKFGGEVFRETVTEYWRDGYPGDFLSVIRNNSPIEVYLFQTPSISENGLWTYSGFASDTWRVNNRLTIVPGVRFDRYRAFLPQQEHPTGRFNSTAQSFAPVDNVISWNLVAPRLGATFDLSGDGKTVAKVNYGSYWFNPGADFLFNVNPNSVQWFVRYAWSDTNTNGHWDPGEQGNEIARRGGTATETLDPDLNNQYTREWAGWFEHELMSNFGVRTGVIWRGERNHYQRFNQNQPFDGFTTPVTVTDPGPDGVVNTADDKGTMQLLDLAPQYRGLTAVNVTKNVPNSDSNFLTWEVTATKRHSNRWSLLATFAYTWSHDQNNSFFGQNLRNNQFPVTPNDKINAGTDGRYDFTVWQGKLNATIEGPWQIKMTPTLRHQAGQPFGRTFSVSLPIYGSVRVLTEEIGTQRQNNINVFDLRLEKVFVLHQMRDSRASLFLDMYNMFNSNAEQNLSWSSGSSYLRPLNIIPPRIARFGAKFEW
jgi:Carboxypeptidase regulatory-like domain